MRKGILFVISGPSGAGKGSVVAKLLSDGGFHFSVSATSRKPRPGEVDGVSYYFISREEFLNWVAEDKFLEYTETYGNCYGTPRKAVMDKLDEGIDVILDIDIAGAKNVKLNYPSAVLIFICPPSLEVLKQRLIGRGTETEEELDKRIAYFGEELAAKDRYDYSVINDVLDDCVNQVRCIISAERNKIKNN